MNRKKIEATIEGLYKLEFIAEQLEGAAISTEYDPAKDKRNIRKLIRILERALEHNKKEEKQ